MTRLPITLAGLVVGLVLLFAANVLGRSTLGGLRWDLTDEGLYSLSEGARNIVRKLDEPVHLDLYVTDDDSPAATAFRTYATRVKELLREFELAADGNIDLQIIDPESFSEAEDEAYAAGIAPVTIQRGSDPFYFGLVASGPTNEREVLPFFNPQEERFLEYEVARLIYEVSGAETIEIGLVTSLPMQGNPMAQMQGGPPDPGWAIVQQLSRTFSVRSLGTAFDAVPEDIDVVWLCHPKGLSDATLYALDQFALSGGRVLVQVDPLCSADTPPQDPNNPMAAQMHDRSSDLNRLLAGWGVEVVPGVLAADRENARQVTYRGPNGQPRSAPYLVWLELDEDARSEEDPVTSQLDAFLLASSGIVRKLDGGTTTVDPLLTTSEESMQLASASILQPGTTPESLLETFLPENQAYALAARVGGPARSAFPDGRPTDATATDGPGDADAAHVASGEVNAIVLADVDFIADNLWTEAVGVRGGSLVYRKVSDNGDFVMNALESLGGSPDLIGLRGRGRYQRPFDRVDEIRRDAEDEYLEEQQALEEKLAEADRRLMELQLERDDQNSRLLSPEQVAEIERYQAERIETRKQLREVQLGLRKDIETLGSSLKWINMLLWPLGIAALSILAGLARVALRRA